MADLFASGRIVDAILALVALEALLLVAYLRRTADGPAPLAVLGNLAAGFCLLLALRAAIGGFGWPWMALALLAAGIAHLADLRVRLRS